MYIRANAKCTPYAGWRLWLLALTGKLLGIQFKVCAIPFGADYDKPMWERWWASQNSGGISAGAASGTIGALGKGA